MNYLYIPPQKTDFSSLLLIGFLLCFTVVTAEAQTKIDKLTQEETRRIEHCLTSETERLMNSEKGYNILKKLQEEGVTCKETGMDIVYQEVMNRIAVPTAKTCLKDKISSNDDWEAFFLNPILSQASYQQTYLMLCARLEESARRSPGQVNKHSLRDATPSVGNCPLLTQDELTTIMTHQSSRRVVKTQNDMLGTSLVISGGNLSEQFFMIQASNGRDGTPAVLIVKASGFLDIPDPLNRVLYSQGLPIAQYVPNEKFSDSQFATCRDLIITLSSLLKK